MPENPNLKPTAQGPDGIFKRVLLSQIRPSRNNPRKIIRQDMINARAASMVEEGQINAIIIRPLTPVELVNDGVIYEIVDGELRYRAALKNGDKDIDAKIEDITPLKAFKVGVSSNRTNKPGWFEDYLAMEEIKKNEPDSQNQELAALFEVDNKFVGRALKLLGVLNEASRALVLDNVQKSPGIWQIAETALYVLADLGNAQTVEKALKVVIDNKMATKQVQKLVQWVKAGNPPETFGTAPKAPKEPKPKTASLLPEEVMAKAIELAKAVGMAEGRGEDTKPTQDLLNAYLDEIKTASANGHHQEPLAQPSHASLADSSSESAKYNRGPQQIASAKEHAGQVPQSFKIISPKGFALLRQKVSAKLKTVTEKMAQKGFKLIIREVFRIEHRICRKLAHAIVPLHARHSGHTPSGQTHSGYRHHRSGSLSQGFMKLFLTVLHWVVYTVIQFVFWWALVMGLVSRLVPFLKPWFEWPFHFAVRLAMINLPSWAWAYGLSHLIPTLIVGCLLGWGYFYAWKVQPTRMFILSLCLGLFYYYGRGWATNADMALAQPNPVPQLEASAQVGTPVPQSTPIADVVKQIVSLSKSKEKRKPTSAPVMAYQPSVSFAPSDSPAQTLYDPKLLQQEIAALPKNCIVKSFPVLTDEGMPGDLAVSRMQGVTDPDKYTMMIGSGKQQIQSITTTTTNLIINYKSTDPFNMFNGPGQLNYFWEDVLYIHTDEINVEDKTPYTIYQLSLVVSGSKYALTIQCASVDDLKHLVSTMQYFIRNSRLGHDTALAGMPYPSQGLVLNNDCVVDKLWAESPMDKAGVTLDDHLWSIGKVASEKQSRNDLETGLKTLPVTFFAASPAEWTKALLARDPAQANSFRPRLRKVSLQLQ